MFRQTKYGLAGSSLAVVGGLIEGGDAGDATPLRAAQRELLEEMGRETRGGDADWHDLGTFRVDVNRGVGYISCFLARHTVLAKQRSLKSSDDYEAQALVELTRAGLRAEIRRAAFQEVKWQATAVLGLMRVDELDAAGVRVEEQEGGYGATNNCIASVQSVQTWVASEAAQGLVGQPLGRLKEAFQLACPEGSVSVDYPGGPKKKRGPSANRLIANTDGKGDGAVVQRVWGYFPNEH